MGRGVGCAWWDSGKKSLPRGVSGNKEGVLPVLRSGQVRSGQVSCHHALGSCSLTTPPLGGRGPCQGQHEVLPWGGRAGHFLCIHCAHQACVSCVASTPCEVGPVVCTFQPREWVCRGWETGWGPHSTGLLKGTPTAWGWPHPPYPGPAAPSSVST